LRNATNDKNAKNKAYISSMKIPPYVKDTLATVMKGNLAFYISKLIYYNLRSYLTIIVLPLIIIFLRMSYQILLEKEKKIREGMKIMGMSDSSFYISYI
jgi:ATP-binding cassette subfamily A (ABC1) protein 3